jgi:hypothetical protein
MSVVQPIPDALTDEGDYAGAESAVGERREGVRREAGFWAGLVTLAGAEVLRCKADNVSEGGLHLTVPIGYGLAVGQRYEVLVGRQEDSTEQGNFLGEGHYATVVRTEFLINDQGDGVGVGLRFDQPVVL